MSDTQTRRSLPHGPLVWIASLVAGLLAGALLVEIAPPTYKPAEHADQQLAQTEHGEQADPHARDDTTGPHADDRPSRDARRPADSIEIAGAGDSLEMPGVGPRFGAPESGDGAHEDATDTHDGDRTPPAHANGHAEGSGAHAGHDDHGPAPIIRLWMVIPFALLLGSIAVMPFVDEHFWHHHFPDFAFFLGGTILSYYLLGFDMPGYTHGLSYGQYKMLHTGLEYYSFIALVGGLYMASGGILIRVTGRGTPLVNASILGFGAVIANIVGTAGASVLLIRPFMRLNEGRLRPIHVVMFIFIVSNCGGVLTPIGDPPLYLGFLKGIPFHWTLVNLWPAWIVCVGILLAIYTIIDWRIGPAPRPEGVDEQAPARTRISVRGLSGFIGLGLIIFGVFVDPLLKAHLGIEGYPVGATFQILAALGTYAVASREIHRANGFNLFPVKEVGLLFVGIFVTMAPALGYLDANGSALGLTSPTALFFATGTLSGVLDNAPTYLNFLQLAFSNEGLSLNANNVGPFLAETSGFNALTAISLAAVFFGAMTYIGNAPNFMVKAIAESGGLRMPSFFGYLLRAIIILGPVLIVIWLIFVR